MSVVRDRLRALLSDAGKAIWSDSDLDGYLAAHQQQFGDVPLERRSASVYACPDGRWLWADGYTPVVRVSEEEVLPTSVDKILREVTLAGAIRGGTVVTADFVGVNIYYAAADAKLAAAGSPERQQAIVAQGQIRLSDKTAAEQLRDDAESLRKLGLPSVVEVTRDQR